MAAAAAVWQQQQRAEPDPRPCTRLLLQALGYGLSSPPPSPSGEQGFELREWLGGFLLPHLAALALPLLPLALPAFIAAANALCAAYLLASLSGMPLHSLRHTPGPAQRV